MCSLYLKLLLKLCSYLLSVFNKLFISLHKYLIVCLFILLITDKIKHGLIAHALVKSTVKEGNLSKSQKKLRIQIRSKSWIYLTNLIAKFTFGKISRAYGGDMTLPYANNIACMILCILRITIFWVLPVLIRAIMQLWD